jgi:hypothetical protein
MNPSIKNYILRACLANSMSHRKLRLMVPAFVNFLKISY